jgi:SAM-dependent methyltransferase
VSSEHDNAAASAMDDWFRGGLMLVLIELGRRAGVLGTIGDRTWRADALAAAANVDRRYLLEWLSAMAAFGLVLLHTDAGGEEQWSLAPELARDLASDGHETLAPLATTVVGAAHQAVRLLEPFCNGGGLSYAERDPNLSMAFEHDARLNYGKGLVEDIVPVVPGLLERLRAGVAVADLGCGSARGLEILARAFPRSRFVGFDSDEGLIAAGRRRLGDRDVPNLQLHAKAIEQLAPEPGFDVVGAFEVIHNLPDPLAALTRSRELLLEGGTFFMYETNATSKRAADIELPWAGPIYTLSLLSCLTVSLAHDGAGYGAMWGVATAESLMADAGFRDIGHREVIDDPVHVVIWGSA